MDFTSVNIIIIIGENYRMCLSSPMLSTSTKNSSWFPFSNLLKWVF